MNKRVAEACKATPKINLIIHKIASVLSEEDEYAKFIMSLKFLTHWKEGIAKTIAMTPRAIATISFWC